jgi:hypothetical protein
MSSGVMTKMDPLLLGQAAGSQRFQAAATDRESELSSRDPSQLEQWSASNTMEEWQ